MDNKAPTWFFVVMKAADVSDGCLMILTATEQRTPSMGTYVNMHHVSTFFLTLLATRHPLGVNFSQLRDSFGSHTGSNQLGPAGIAVFNPNCNLIGCIYKHLEPLYNARKD